MILKLKTIWNDIRRGENLELYITVIASIITLTLTLIDFTKPEWINSILLAVLAMLAVSILGIRQRLELLIRKRSKSFDSSITIIKEGSVCNSIIIEHIEKKIFKEAKLIQYSGTEIKPVIHSLLSHGIFVHLLLQHSDLADGEFQMHRMGAFLECISRDFRTYKNYEKNLKIDLYKAKASIRGVKLDKRYLSIGWYTYERIENRDSVWGHPNASIFLSLDDPSSKSIEELFDKTFNNLLENSEHYFP